MADAPQPARDLPRTEVRYPERDARQKQSQGRSIQYYAWNGSKDQLSRIYSIIEDALKRALEKESDRLKKAEEWTREGFLRDLVPTAEVVLRTSSRTSGDLDAILAISDPRDILSVLLRNQQDRYFVKVGFSNSGTYPFNDPGVTISVSGADAHWVAGTSDALDREVKKDVPRWTALKKPFIVWPHMIAILSVFVPALLVAFLAGRTALASYASIVSICWPPVAWFGMHQVIKRGLRSFEVVEQGTRSQAARTIGILVWVTVIVGFVASVLGIVSFFGQVPPK